MTPLRLLLAVALVAGFGCGRRPAPRPMPGDRVRPQLMLNDPWKANRLVPLNVRLLVQGPHDTEPQFLQVEEIPEDAVPHGQLLFYRDAGLLKEFADVPLKRFC